MRVELFPFQKRALADIRMKTAEAMGSYHRTHAPQVVSFTAPTGAGKTIIMSALIEAILFGDEQYMEQPDAIIVWLSDSPQLIEQSKQKIDSKADKIKLSQCVTVSEESFDKEVFEDGHVYFLNTQKLSVTSKLTKNGDGRTYTIWQTLANTVREKSDRLYFILDDAHRGMQGREASKATTGNLPVNAVRCSMNELLSQVEGEYGDKLSAAELTLVSVMPDKELFCNVDGALMWRVIDNLLSNICKYAQNGTRVYLTLEKTGGEAVVTFKNTSRAALNIPAEELMERFVRGDSSRSTEGNGLGLSIAQSLTELQGGKMALAIDGDLFKAILRFPTVV